MDDGYTLRLTPKEMDALWAMVFGYVNSTTEDELMTASGDPAAIRRVVVKMRRLLANRQ